MNKIVKLVTSVCLIAFSTLVVSVNQILAYEVPSYDGYVNDYADVLSAEFEQNLEERLQNVSSGESGAELAVVTISSLEGEPVEYVSQDFFDEWKIGKKEFDNGVLLLIAVEDRELRIATGYGAEIVIPDSVAGRIIRNDITPYFKESDYESGITAGVDKILSYLDNPEEFDMANIENTVENGLESGIGIMFLMWIFVAGVSYLFSFLGRTKSWWLGGIIGLVLGLITGGIISAIVVGLFGLLLDYILSKNYKNLKKAGKSTSWTKSWGGFSSGGGWSSGSSSGGSFGGGSSGGGGASGKW